MRIPSNEIALPARSGNVRPARVERLIAAQAWTDAALALLELELPQWRVRRLVYDDDEWHCALSRHRAMPDWLDQTVETHDTDLAQAILGALAEARRISAPMRRASVPTVVQNQTSFYEPVTSENFA
jgi:hypothetical protein